MRFCLILLYYIYMPHRLSSIQKPYPQYHIDYIAFMPYQLVRMAVRMCVYVDCSVDIPLYNTRIR